MGSTGAGGRLWRGGALALTVCATVGSVAIFRLARSPPATVRPEAAAAAPVSEQDERDRKLWAVDFGAGPSVDPDRALGKEVSRRVLALYDSSETFEEEDDHEKFYQRPVDSQVALAHRLAELPLNHLGLVLDFADVNAPLPDDEHMRGYRGVLVWFGDDKLREPAAYLEWLAAQPALGRRVVVLEHLGAFEDLDGQAAPPELIAKALAAVGGTYLGNWSDDPSVIALVKADPKLVGFESPLSARLDFYQQYRASPRSTAHLTIERTDLPDSHSDVVWTGPTGGYVAPGYVYAEDRLGERYVLRWVLNPFAFFEKAFGVEGFPRFDFTTRNGQRIFYSQIDGDGLDMISELDYKTTCGAWVRDHVLKQYELPFTASIVVGLTAPPPLGRGSRELVEVARSVLALDNIEVASHGVAHPMDWRAGSVKGYSADEAAVMGLPGYPASDDVAGRGEIEIAASVKFIDEHLAPPDKKCRTMLWTGWCNPSEGQLGVAYRLKLRNMNGGDPRM
ncbi:MAG: polysaccharide deacetylase family protein, partial [Myxococcaceae bacterium]